MSYGAKSLGALAATLMISSCDSSLTTGGALYDCYPVYDRQSFYLYDQCAWYHYDSNGARINVVDTPEFNGDTQAYKTKKLGRHYEQKFSLPSDIAANIASAVIEFESGQSSVKSRFEKLIKTIYGINPQDAYKSLIKSPNKSSELSEQIPSIDFWIEQATQSMAVDQKTVRKIINELHGRQLKAKGIEI